ncbi:hypothetical protein AMATHDRAFT_45428 [Amanita thiersii Skay4041]|uniref:DUF6699 domain-containing protein n=1 Tax=Amanita thiersii Skay4041 TaxID=703135 RepID=A0A2A9NSP4_9AGAR|nr:hypothetical protein AMATHDRAFT_45428 [Amanita thiersii Skay4041]
MSRHPSPNVTPFIPPLSSPQASPQPPVIPSQRSSTSSTPLPPSQYPNHFVYPGTPYSPYVPSVPSFTPAMMPANLQSSAYSPFAMPNHPPPNSSPLSVDYTGYPQYLAPTPYSQSAQLPPPQHNPSQHPPPPHGTPWSAPLYPPAATPWAQPTHLPHYPPFQGAPVLPPPHAFYNMAQATPPHGAFSPLAQPDPWGLAAAAAALAHHPPPPPAWAVHPPVAQPHSRQGPLSRTTGYIGDRVDDFTPGSSYGPVLTPFLVGVVNPRLKLNPLIIPLADDASDRAHLRWNMLYPSNYCQRSDDKPHVSWSKGRDAPATFPRVLSLRIVTQNLPWTVDVDARNPTVGVTCGDLIDAISDSMNRMTGGADYHSLSESRKRIISEAYHYNRSIAADVPGGRLKPGLMRLDFLCQDSMFGGIEINHELVKKITGAVLPCVFVLKCRKRPRMTEAEAREQREITRNLGGSSTSASTSKSPSVTIETVSPGDSD